MKYPKRVAGLSGQLRSKPLDGMRRQCHIDLMHMFRSGLLDENGPIRVDR